MARLSGYAIILAENLRRYRTRPRGSSVWDNAGPYVPQKLIPRCTAAQKREAERIMSDGFAKDGGRLGAVRWVRVSRLRSFQHCLRHRSLLWHVTSFERMQTVFRSRDMDIRGVNLPIVVWSKGVPVIWNGNHRATAAILHNRKWMRARVYKKKSGR